jgi:hypothetical protein
VYLLLSILILNETIRVDLIVFLGEWRGDCQVRRYS